MKFRATAHFEFLLTNASNLSRLAEPVFPNHESLAMVGFSLAGSSELWGAEHVQYLAAQLPPFETSPVTGGHADARFAALCMGYLLGIRECGRISEQEFWEAGAVLPGFIALHVNDVASPC
jgi:hypothetical protein